MKPQTREVLLEVEAERQRQNEKWGEQNHHIGLAQNFNKVFAAILAGPNPEAEVKAAWEVLHDRGTLTWKDILFEEVVEFFEARDPASAREELIQVAAVAVAAVEYLDRANLANEVAFKRGER